MSKIKTIEAKIKDVHWITDRRGFLQPILRMTKKLPDGFDSLAIPLKEVRAMGVGIGSIFRLEKEEGTTYNIKSAIKLKTLSIPDNCPACGSELITDNCSYEFCFANGRTPMRKLLTYFAPKMPIDIVDVYLDNFPKNFETTVKIEDFSDFLYHLKAVGGLGTTARHSILEKHFGQILPNYMVTVNDLASWEFAVVDAMTLTKAATLNMTTSVFWDLFYINKLSEEDRILLSSVDPLLLDFRKLPLSKEGNKLLIENAEMLLNFLSVFKK